MGWQGILYGRIYVDFSFLALHKVCTKARLLGERSVRIREVEGSIPFESTTKKYRRYVCICGIFVVRYTLVDLKRLFWCFTLRENHYRENYCEIIGLNQKVLENQGILV